MVHIQLRKSLAIVPTMPRDHHHSHPRLSLCQDQTHIPIDTSYCVLSQVRHSPHLCEVHCKHCLFSFLHYPKYFIPLPLTTALLIILLGPSLQGSSRLSKRLNSETGERVSLWGRVHISWSFGESLVPSRNGTLTSGTLRIASSLCFIQSKDFAPLLSASFILGRMCTSWSLATQHTTHTGQLMFETKGSNIRKVGGRDGDA